MVSLRYLNGVLTVIAVLLALNFWTVAGSGSLTGAVQTVEAQADSGRGVGSTAARQQEMVQALSRIQQSVDRIERTMTSGSLVVKIDGERPK